MIDEKQMAGTTVPTNNLYSVPLVRAEVDCGASVILELLDFNLDSHLFDCRHRRYFGLLVE